MKKIVVALGGNALEDGNSPNAENQLKVIKETVKHIADLIKDGFQVIITHGNGPQVGRIALQNEMAKETTPSMPFDICGAMSQGMIGYHIQQALKEELETLGLKSDAVSVVTQVAVDKNDSAFANPTKPIGPFYSKEEALKLSEEKGYHMIEDSGRGFRRVIASPKPIEIIELNTIRTLLDNNINVITVGGGGIPVIKEGISLKGVEAVIDKDFASSKLAQDINADILVILTEVEKIALNFGKENQKWLDKVSLSEVDTYIKEGHFAPGSMLPKVEACVNFVKSKQGRKALITSLAKAGDALKGNTGTHIIS